MHGKLLKCSDVTNISSISLNCKRRQGKFTVTQYIYIYMYGVILLQMFLFTIVNYLPFTPLSFLASSPLLAGFSSYTTDQHIPKSQMLRHINQTTSIKKKLFKEY